MSQLNIWDFPLLASARYGLTEIELQPRYQINYSAFSDPVSEARLIVNPITGLIGSSAISQSICDQSTVNLLIALHNDTAYASLNSALPNLFQSSQNVRLADCNQHRVYGLQLLRGIDQYQRDCAAYCFASTVGGYRKRLGTPFDSDLENGDDASVSPYLRNISNALVRLLTCDTSGWFAPNVTMAVYNVFRMCASKTACTRLCVGIVDEDEAQAYQSAVFQPLLDFVDSLSPEDKKDVCTPSVVADLLQPVSQVASLFGQDLGWDPLGPDVAQYIDTLANPLTGNCSGYDSAMAGLQAASGAELSPFPELAATVSLPSVRGVRSPAFAACQASIQRYNNLCNGRSASDLCARATAADVATKGSFDTCGDSGLQSYFVAVSDYNLKCGAIGFPTRPTNGPVRFYYSYPDGKIDMADCFPDRTGEIVAFFVIFIVLWLLVLCSLAYAKLSGCKWLASSDLTMDISRSRAFNVFGTLWLLYFFNRFYLDVLVTAKLNNCTVWPNCGGDYFPLAIYTVIVFIMWVAAFSAIFIANNPFRRYGGVLSLVGMAISHYYTALIVQERLKDMDLNGNTLSYQGQDFFHIVLICVLQAAMDVCYLHVVLGQLLGWKSFHQIRGENYTKHVTDALSKPSGDADGCDGSRVLVTCVLPAGARVPSYDVHNDLAAWVGGRENFVLVSVTDQGAPGPDHLTRARQLKVGGGEDGTVILVEAILVRDCEQRALVLRSEERRATGNGRVQDAARLRAERWRAEAGMDRSSPRDARLLVKILGSDLFAEAVGDPHAERFFGAAIAALHHFCRSQLVAAVDRAPLAVVEQFKAAAATAAATAGLGANHMELLCLLPEAELKNLAVSGMAHEILKDKAVGIYHRGRQQLIGRLCDERFLAWLVEGLRLDADRDRVSASNPFSFESSALDAFTLAQKAAQAACSPARPSIDAPLVRARMVKDVQTGGEEGDGSCRKGVFKLAIGVSERRDAWATWADSPKGLLQRFMVGQTAYVPSILFICVGIATVIILTNFVGMIAFGAASRDTINSYMDKLSDFSFIFQNMAIGSLNLASCIDPVQFKVIQTTTLANYLPQLASWDPVAYAIQQAMSNPDLASVLNIQPVMDSVQAIETNIGVLEGDVAQIVEIQGAFLNVTSALMSTLASVSASNIASKIGILESQVTQILVIQQQVSNLSNAAKLSVQPTLKEVSNGFGGYMTNLEAQLSQTLPTVVQAAAFSIIANVTQPAVLATLPVFGSTLKCLFAQFGSTEVQGFIAYALALVNNQTAKAHVQISVGSNDTCRCATWRAESSLLPASACHPLGASYLDSDLIRWGDSFERKHRASPKLHQKSLSHKVGVVNCNI